MTRTIGSVVTTLLGTLALVGPAAAADNNLGTTDDRGGFTMTLAGRGTAAQAASDDTELACCYRRFYGGYYAGYTVGYSYPVFYGGYNYGCGGFGCGYYGVSFYRPIYTVTYPVYYRGFYGCCGRGFGFFGISGTQQDASAPVISLATSAGKHNPAVKPTDTTTSSRPTEGGFRYDGGPADPVPLPKPDATPAPSSSSPTGLPVSFTPSKSKPARYTYKAYGEK
jgi:hypothetical protein